MNRVSSYHKPAGYLAVFFVVALFALACACSVSASDITAQKVVSLANADRKEKGLDDLIENEKLEKAAMEKAEDMISKNYFSHTSSENITPWHWIEKENYEYNYAGENLAMDFTSAEKMNQAWLESPTHRANILSEKYKDIGVAVKEGIISGHVTIVVVQFFGSGDKNSSGQKATPKGPTTQPEESHQAENFYPQLPLDSSENKQARLAAMEPVITSPSIGEIVSEKKMEIFGRANPLARVFIFDEEKEIGAAIAGNDGWFRLPEIDFSAGEHSLVARSEWKNGRKVEAQTSSRKIAFTVDADKPTIRYKLYAEENLENEYLLKIIANEENCKIILGGEKIYLGRKKLVTTVVSGKKLSEMVRIEDQAGNKSFREVNFSSLRRKNNNEKNFLNSLARIFVPEKALAKEADDSGRKAFSKNLGLTLPPIPSDAY